MRGWSGTNCDVGPPPPPPPLRPPPPPPTPTPPPINPFGPPPPAPASGGCIDDPSGAVAAAGQTCAAILPMLANNCDYDLSTLTALIPAGTSLRLACPLSCNDCGAATGGRGGGTTAPVCTTPGCCDTAADCLASILSRTVNCAIASQQVTCKQSCLVSSNVPCAGTPPPGGGH